MDESETATSDRSETASLLEAIQKASSAKHLTPMAVCEADVARVFCLALQSGFIEWADDGKEKKKLASIPVVEMTEEQFRILSSAAEAAATLISKGKSIRMAVEHLGTHTGKVPDAGLSPAIATAMKDAVTAADAGMGVCSATLRTNFRLSAGGNAKITAEYRWLCTAYAVGDAPPRQMAEILAERGAAFHGFRATLPEAAAEALDAIADSCATRLACEQGILPDGVNGASPQVLFPRGDGTYIALSPLYTCAIGSELTGRLSQRRSQQEGQPRLQLIAQRTTKAGGTKPQNSGLLASDLFGRFPRLRSGPPTAASMSSSKVLWHFRRKGLPVSAGVVQAETFMEFTKACGWHAVRNNAETRDRRLLAAKALIEDVMAPLREVAAENDDAYDRTGRPLATLASLPAESRDLGVLLGLPEHEETPQDDIMPPDDGAIERAAELIADKVCSGLRARAARLNEAPPFAVDDELMGLMTALAVQKLEEFVQ